MQAQYLWQDRAVLESLRAAFALSATQHSVCIFALAPGLRVLHNGEAVFQTQPVRELPEGKAGASEVSELPGTVQGGGIVIDVAVDMLLIRVGHHKKGVVALELSKKV